MVIIHYFRNTATILHFVYAGGGFVVGDLSVDEPDLKILCTSENISILSVDYRLAPEHVFPTQIDDSFAALKWVCAVQNSSLLRADLNKGVIVAGASAGANLAAVVALRARDDPAVSQTVTGQILQIPWIADSRAYPDKYKDDLRSMFDLSDRPMLTKYYLEQLADLTKLDFKSPKFSPLYADSLEGLPKAFIQIAGSDPLRDDGILYARLLKEAGVEVQSDIYPGTPHGFRYAGPETAAAKKWRQDVVKGVKWILESTSGNDA
ncbi:hypothetical protein SISSUDRAFT_1027591 [Sistotremastrum suecicum HHB10207 ss-3]|uniref:Alpha/beta hydrolase fold-3 domain-containing protein n=1 Tax=Sistotremastrum suecicum HHB10207 ss-3 TaxID=1314776 RepID=A0A165YQ46_9AGAM|nr:hypothetical protein SISSUDRAFT_1027591 [Sistotremastrum suecicum HHB10207 ss-3]